MKIIQNNYTKENKVSEEYICEECNSVFEYDDYDVYVDKDGIESVDCPCCNHRCIVYTPVTEKNIEFPKSFYEFGVHEGAVDTSNEIINSNIKEAFVWLKRHPEAPFRYCGIGNTFICVFNHDDEYYIMVAKNYFDCSIDK